MKHKLEAIIGSCMTLIVLLIIGSTFYLNQQRQVEVKHVNDLRSTGFNLKQNKAISDKLGIMIWPYADSKVSQEDALTNIRAQVIAAKRIHASYVRVPLYLSENFIHNDRYDNEYFHEAINTILDSGMTPIVPFHADTSVSQKRSINFYKGIIFNEIHYFSGKGVIWESWNEANIQEFWFNKNAFSKTTIAQWVGLNEKVERYIKRNDRSATFLSGDLAAGQTGYTPDEFQNQLEDAYSFGLFKDSQAVSIHPYVIGQPEQLLNNDDTNKMAQLRNFLNSKKISAPIVTTEIGYSTEETWQGRVTNRQQANYDARVIFILDSMHQPIISLYSVIGGWGIYNNNLDGALKMKPAAKLISVLMKKLSGYKYWQTLNVGNSDCYCLLYRKNNKVKKVVWTVGTDQNLKVHSKSTKFTQRPNVSKW
ncbi:hypothetical protein [Lactiplantibacillus pentosus]|uniref:hypothetical protein n=1 Tax=Lactiplantibacillus pentosus TaxID=1589 RepID=UPI0021820076|nr:hypothetical protein [Lactiplantibacillus pentosus]MCT0162164.1 hypothetical protein [Lactiplantibacillus pentosus]